MKRTTVELPDDLDTRLHDEAARRQTTVSALTQEAIEAYLPSGPTLRPGQRRKLRGTAAGRSGQHDISERIEEILREEFPES